MDTYESFVWEPSLVKTNAITAATEAACLVSPHIYFQQKDHVPSMFVMCSRCLHAPALHRHREAPACMECQEACMQPHGGLSCEYGHACRSCRWMKQCATRGRSRQREQALAGPCPGAAGQWACGAGAAAAAGACGGDDMHRACSTPGTHPFWDPSGWKHPPAGYCVTREIPCQRDSTAHEGKCRGAQMCT